MGFLLGFICLSHGGHYMIPMIINPTDRLVAIFAIATIMIYGNQGLRSFKYTISKKIRANFQVARPPQKPQKCFVRMSRLHRLQDAAVQLTCNGETLERVQSIKLLGVTMDEHFSWIEHVKALLSSCYGVLSMLRKLRNLAPFHIRKQLGESLILSKLDYSCVVFHPLQLYQQKQLQKVQNVCASFVLGRYAREADSLQLGWLPVAERRQFQVLLSAFKALYFLIIGLNILR